MQITEITAENFQAEISQSKLPVLLDFYADWCVPCQNMRPELEAFAAQNPNIKVCALNVENAGILAQIYGVLSVPTLLLLQGAQETARRVGGGETADIARFVNDALK